MAKKKKSDTKVESQTLKEDGHDKAMANMLNVSELRYRRLFESAKEGILILDAETGMIDDVNPYLIDLLGYSHEQFLGKTIWELGFFKDIVANKDKYEELQRKQYIRYEDLPLETADGRRIDVEFISNVYLENIKKVIQCNIRDITERKKEKEKEKEKEKLRNSEDRWHFALEGSGDGVWDWNAKTNEVFFSHRWKSMLGYQDSEIGNTLDEWNKRVHHDDKERVYKDINNHFEGRMSEYRNEHRVLCKDGTYKWILDRGKVISRDENGKPLRVIGVHTDITERKKAEEALRESLQRLEFSLQGGNLGMWDWNPQDDTVVYSDLWAQMLEYRPDEVDPTVDFFKQHVHPEDLAAVIDRLTGHVEGRLPVYESEHRIRTKSGRWLWVLDRGKISDRDKDGRPVRVTGIIADITERKKLEDAREFLVQCGCRNKEDGFFQDLARYLAETLDMDFVCIDKLCGDGLDAQTVAVYSDGKFEDNLRYALKDTPCGDVVGKTICCFPRDVRKLFPIDDDLRKLAAESYVGTILWGFEGKPIGLIAVIGKKPLESNKLAESILGLVSIRAAGELERMNADEILRKSEERFRNVVAASEEYVFEVDMNGIITFISDRVRGILGYEPQELLGKTPFDVMVSPEEVARVSAIFNECVKNSRSFQQLEHTCLSKDGRELALSVSAIPFFNEAGEIKGYQGTVEDITKRKRTEKELRESEEFFKMLFIQSPVGIEIYNESGELQTVNGSCLKIFGIKSASDVRDLNLFEDPNITAEMKDKLRHGETVRYECLFDFDLVKAQSLYETSRSDKIWLDLMISPMFIDDKISGYIVHVDEISQRKNAEIALNSLKDKLEALYTISSLKEASTKTISDHILESIGKMTGSKYGFYGFIKDDESVMTIHSWSGDAMKNCKMVDKPADFPIGEAGVWGEAIRRREPFILNDYAAAHGAKKGLPAGHVPLANLLVVPHFTHGKITSVAAVANKTSDYVQEDVAQILTFMNSVTAIVDAKRSEAALKDSEERYRALFNSVTDAVFVHESSEEDMPGRILLVNDIACKRLGYTREELLSMSVQDIDASESTTDRQAVIKELKAGRSVLFEQIHKARDGRLIPVELNAQGLTVDGRFMLLSVVRDITERKQAEEKLSQIHDLLSNLAHMVPGTIYQYVLHPDGSSLFPYSSPGMNDIYEVTPEEISEDATPVFGRLHPDDYDHVSNSIQESARTLQTFYCEFRVLLPRQGLRWRWSQAQPERMADGGTLWHGVIIDITALKLAEKEKEKLRSQLLQSQKMEAVGQLAGGMAHDFNNMLGVILGATELAKMEIDEDSTAREELQTIIEAVMKARELSMKLLTFARRDKVSVAVVEASKIIDNLKGMLIRTIPKSIELKAVVKDKIVIKCDPNQIHQALINICNNAVDAMPNGGPLVIEAEEVQLPDGICGDCGQKLDGRYCLIQVTDTGIGMQKEILTRITEPFYTTKGVGKGTGLGLSVTQGIIQSHDGHLHIYSEPGKGTCVKMYLPIAEDSAVHVDEIADKKPLGGNETILVVDDEVRLLELAGKLLAKNGYKPLLADNGNAAVELYRKHQTEIDCVVLDLMMPGMDGAEVNRRLKELNPDVKVMYASGFSEDGVAAALLKEKNRGFVQKPFEMGVLCQSIRGMIDGG
jgi:PAS domain S-box-containing protein